MAIEDGCPCTPRDTAPREALVRWIRTHPGHVKAARIESNLRRRRDDRGLGIRLRRLRDKRGLSQERVASDAGLSTVQYQRLE